MERLSHARAVEGLSGGCRGDTTIKDMNNNVRQNGLCRRVLAACVLGAAVLPGVADDRHRPHIVLVMLDDMGFSDLGCYGGEVETPHIDSLAAAGVRFSHFWNTGRSCPSRASLLTGCYQHDAGMGWMTAVDEHRPGYRGQVARELPLVSDLLRSVGYRTYMSGKWHITVDGAFGRPNGTYPVERGFDRSYGSLTGGSDYWAPRFVYSGLTPVDGFPDDFYYTTAITDSAVSFVRSHPADSPMWPMMLPTVLCRLRPTVWPVAVPVTVWAMTCCGAPVSDVSSRWGLSRKRWTCLSSTVSLADIAPLGRS